MAARTKKKRRRSEAEIRRHNLKRRNYQRRGPKPKPKEQPSLKCSPTQLANLFCAIDRSRINPARANLLKLSILTGQHPNALAPTTWECWNHADTLVWERKPIALCEAAIGVLDAQWALTEYQSRNGLIFRGFGKGSASGLMRNLQQDWRIVRQIADREFGDHALLKITISDAIKQFVEVRKRHERAIPLTVGSARDAALAVRDAYLKIKKLCLPHTDVYESFELGLVSVAKTI